MSIMNFITNCFAQMTNVWFT